MKFKICGLKYEDNVKQVAALHPDYMGFIFYPQSKRYVGEHFKLPYISSRIKKVGVFVNAAINDIVEKADKYKLDCIQLHGDESISYCENLTCILSSEKKETIRELKIIKTFGIDECFDFGTTKNYKSSCNYFLFDTKTNGYGGSGKQFSWSLLKNYDQDVPFFLSGGIGSEDIEKIKDFKIEPYAIDVNSKFEIQSGVKNIKELSRIL